MQLRRGVTAFSAVCVFVLVSLVLADVAAYARHTDDGCAVEFHCLACVWAMAATAEIIPPVDPGPDIELTGRIVAATAPRPVEAPTPELASRGPPWL
jgi:hypothetical protein